MGFQGREGIGMFSYVESRSLNDMGLLLVLMIFSAYVEPLQVGVRRPAWTEFLKQDNTSS